MVRTLPTGYVIMLARRVWHKELAGERPELGHLIAGQITEMSETDRAIYQDYLQRLAARVAAEEG